MISNLSKGEQHALTHLESLQGFVANDVESEQIVADALTTPFFLPNSHSTTDPSKPPPPKNRTPSPRYTSYVQIRGSIPVYWSQETGNYKPPIEIAPRDPFFAAAARHFDHLFELYGAPVVVFNLIRVSHVPLSPFIALS